MTGTGERRWGLAAVTAALGGLALLAVRSGAAPEPRVGALLVIAAALELFHGFRRATDAGQREAWMGGAITLLMGLLLLNAPDLAAGALVVFLGSGFVIDGIRHAKRALAARKAGRPFAVHGWAAFGDFSLAALLGLLGGWAPDWVVPIAGALRIFGTAWGIAMAPVFDAGDAGETVLRDLGLEERPEAAALAEKIEDEETRREPIDRRWILVLILTLFAIHLGRMGFDRTALGIVAPGVAVIGDLFVALVVGFLIVLPGRLLWLRLTARLARRVTDWRRTANPSWRTRLADWWLTRRLRVSIQLRDSRYSLPAAAARSLRVGLPVAAVFAATIPVWGMSWYFDTENWASGVWDSWAEERSDVWREAMTAATAEGERAAGRPADFALRPEGTGSDFAFVVVGDTGEGDASQHVLRRSLLHAAAQPEVKFVIVSSDVVYPSGEMKDYEKKFWLPFMGIEKPVYAIPGNHDWYDALEGFAVTFFTPEAARRALRARAEADLRLTTTTDAEADRLVAEAARLRAAYDVPTGFQQAPYFQIQTPAFALIAVDTGVRRAVDASQLAWLESALDASRGKFTMALLGHPFYAVGAYRGDVNEDFLALHGLLRERGVSLVMAGDTHDLEYYREPGVAGRAAMHHVVNGGGGAYLSLGTALAKPESMPTPEWAFYPSTEPLVGKVVVNNPTWKRPVWFWASRLGGWPWSSEWLSAAFDYNVAPFFQSFVEVRVEPSAGRVRLLPWGVHGRLRWSDLQTSDGLRPEGVAPDAPVEWSLPLGTPAR